MGALKATTRASATSSRKRTRGSGLRSGASGGLSWVLPNIMRCTRKKEPSSRWKKWFFPAKSTRTTRRPSTCAAWMGTRRLRQKARTTGFPASAAWKRSAL